MSEKRVARVKAADKEVASPDVRVLTAKVNCVQVLPALLESLAISQTPELLHSDMAKLSGYEPDPPAELSIMTQTWIE
ncbi:hypothetical protein LTR15_009061 [Elasticomyces elasticus]|nr:hypothetical protein LTR15_009061 [Elasticomyces elasticus]